MSLIVRGQPSAPATSEVTSSKLEPEPGRLASSRRGPFLGLEMGVGSSRQNRGGGGAGDRGEASHGISSPTAVSAD